MLLDLLALARVLAFDATVEPCGPKCDRDSSTVNKSFEKVSLKLKERRNSVYNFKVDSNLFKFRLIGYYQYIY